MKFLPAGVLFMGALTAHAVAQTENFDTAAAGAHPAGWKCGVTGRGNARWQVEADDTAPSKSQVLKQAGRGDYPWCVKEAVSVKDGFVEVKFRSIAGRDDQAGGVVWRWKDSNNYYVARANALENNVSLYYTENGNRKTIKYADAPVPRNVWHTLRVNFTGTKIDVLLDGKRYIQLDDQHSAAAGAVGVWTKGDSVTAFDDFAYGDSGRKP
jgi:hypothetical protein